MNSVYRTSLSVLLGLLLVLSVGISVTVGPVTIPPGTVVTVLVEPLPVAGNWVSFEGSASTRSIVWRIRLPRVLLAVLVGAGLSVVGTALQALVRNPLADPYILGISSGASVGASLVIVFGVLGVLGTAALSAAACLGAFATLMAVFLLAREGHRVPVVRLLLAGIAMSAILSALTSFILFVAPRDTGVAEVYFWIMGSLSGAEWSALPVPALVVIPGIVVLAARARSLNVMLMGDEAARGLGLDVARFRKFLLLHSTLLTGVLVAVSGAIGFVGLIVPHVVRMMLGADHRRLVPVAALVGAIFLVWVDVAARTVMAPQELPIGILTAITGGPFFIWLMRRREYAFGGEPA